MSVGSMHLHAVFHVDVEREPFPREIQCMHSPDPQGTAAFATAYYASLRVALRQFRSGEKRAGLYVRPQELRGESNA